jgi:hypothetical protein
MAKIYIVCPVRKLNEPEKNLILKSVTDLEKAGNEVRCPFRDTNQVDEIGLRIVGDHEDDIIWADEVLVWWNPTSEGSLWDAAQFRMAKRFMPEKRFLIINLDGVQITEEKSYTNVLLATHFKLTPVHTLADLKWLKDQG